MAIELKKSGDRHRINLDKSTDASGPRGGASPCAGEIKINLDWTQKKSGLLGRLFSSPNVDLDLGCFYELRDGRKMLIDGLQFSHGRGGARDAVSRQGCYTQAPYIWHRGDDRGSSSESGETILVNPAGAALIRRIIVYTFIFEGVANWSQTDAVVRVSVPGNEDVVVRMGEQNTNKRFCAIAAIEFGTDNTMTVEKLVTFHDNHSDCDRQYGWGFNYSAGSKD